MSLYLTALKMHIKSQLQYKKAFIAGLLSQIAVLFSNYFIILTLFSKFQNIKGFTLYEILLCYAIIQFGFSFNEIFARGIDRFSNLIITAKFDQILLRPRNIMLQVLCSQIDIIKTSRLIQAIIILFIALFNLDISYDVYKIITLILMLISSIVIFFSIFLFMASYCFFTVQGLEIASVFTYGGKNMAQYPIGVFNKKFIFIFTFIIPYAFVNYYPLLFLLGKSENILYVFSPLLVFLTLIPAFTAFKIGMRYYSSTGS